MTTIRTQNPTRRTDGATPARNRIGVSSGASRSGRRWRLTKRDVEPFPDTLTAGRAEIRALRRRYELSERERGALREIGCFRTIDTEALLKHRYSGSDSAMRNEIAGLQQQGLPRRRSISVGKKSRHSRNYRHSEKRARAGPPGRAVTGERGSLHGSGANSS